MLSGEASLQLGALLLQLKQLDAQGDGLVEQGFGFGADLSSSMLPASPSASIMKRLATTMPKLPRLSFVFHFSDCMCPSTVPVRS